MLLAVEEIDAPAEHPRQAAPASVQARREPAPEPRSNGVRTEARLELERFFDTRLFLDLHVKVRGEWRNDERILDEMGLGKRGH